MGDEYVPDLAIVLPHDRGTLVSNAAQRLMRSGLRCRQGRWLDCGRVPDSSSPEPNEVDGQIPSAGTRHPDTKRRLRHQPTAVAVVPAVLIGIEIRAVHETDVGRRA